MPNDPSQIYVIVFLFLLVLAILWFFLPFAIFGTKPLLQELIIETKKTNALLEKIALAENPATTHQLAPSHLPEPVIAGG